MSESNTQEPRSASVLVVDDNEANRSLARHTLEDEGYRVIVAEGGPAAIAAFERERPDCLLLDVNMPEMNGFTVCERIRALPGGESTPVIFLTALRDVDTFDRALRAGGDDFLTKPVRPTELVVRVQSALKLRQMRFELREHYTLLKKQRDDMIRLQLQKERLTAFVVHDLKNPVNAMDLHAQILLRDKSLSQSARDSAAQIRTEARQLNRMILNLLDVSKADEGKLAPKRVDVDLENLVGQVIGELEASAGSRNVTLEASVEAKRVSADEDLLRRAIANLAENAIRHAPQKSAVRITTARVDNVTELRIRDFGEGVPVEMRTQIFEPFVQLTEGGVPPSRAGRGLGLAFCKLAIEAHGGEIHVEDANPGAAFIVRLPDVQ
jgi:signal transduction histidine kinase